MLKKLTQSLAAVAFLAHSPLALAFTPENAPTLVPGAYIVEFEDSATQAHSDIFYTNLTRNSVTASPRLDLSHSLFKGASFQLHHDEAEHESLVDMIESMTIVKKMWPVRLFPRPDVEATPIKASQFSPHSKAKRDQMMARDAADPYAVHVMGGVDKLRTEGYTGKGIFVAVIDSGVDYKHPALGGGFGPGFKVARGYDFVGDSYNGSNTPFEDNDPYSSCGSHGTHVSGIVGADPNEFNFTGVAPDATLGMYRVFGCTGSAGNDVLIKAFMRAHDDNADIITASIGGASGWSEDPWAEVVSRIVQSGTPCSIAAGNEGADGIFYASTAADAIGALAVGSVDSVTNPILTYLATYTTGSNGSTGSNSTSSTFSFAAGEPGYPDAQLQLWAPDFDITDQTSACQPFPTGTPDLSKKMVLIRRGGCFFTEKASHATAHGAKYILFYNNVEGAMAVTLSDPTILGVGMTTPEQGAKLINLLKQGIEVHVNITNVKQATESLTVVPNTATGGFMSTYSTWGPTFEGQVKPEVSAPGGNILSTYPLSMGGYAAISGTSMATPYIAGCIALMLQARGNLSPATISSLLSSTAKPMTFNDGTKQAYPYLTPPIQQGGGMVDAYAALHTKTILSTTALEFNDTAHFAQSKSFEIRNTGSSSVTYTLSNSDAASVYALPSNGSMVPSSFPPDLTADHATVSINHDSITIAAGASETITICITPPAGLSAARLPVYGGFIYVNGTNGEILGLPYSGIAGDLKSARIINTEQGFPFLASNSGNQSTSTSSPAFTITQSNTTDFTGPVPTLMWNLAMGSSLVDVQLFSVNSTSSLGSIGGYPVYNQPRANSGSGAFNGQLVTGKYVPAGKYQLVLSALKIFGDSSKKEDFEIEKSIPFSISYTN